jgi:tRNA-2-methylthio-N6-dimethylallyladenosine synthase
MNRSHDAATYLGLIARMRAARPDIAISGDFIVGFPGETEEDFGATLSIVAEVGYAAAYSFKYSARPGTPAAVMEGQIPREVMDERLQRLQARIGEHSLAFNRSKVGADTQILIERAGRRDGQMIGKSPWLQSVHVETGAPPGDMLDVTLVAALPNSLTGAVRQKRALSVVEGVAA